MKTTYTNMTFVTVIITTTESEVLTVPPLSSIMFKGEIKKSKFNY